MRRTLELLRAESRARVFFAVMTQSAVGTGAGYVALLLIAYERFRSPWAISLVLIADLVAPMIFGPLFGAMADRWSRRSCAVAADLISAVAFVGVAVVDGFAATVAFALLAGVGAALFMPATLASLPSLVTEKRLPAATALYGAIRYVGLASGPAVAALVLIAAGPEAILFANAATFATSMLCLLTIDFGRAPIRELGDELSLFADARAGLRATRGIRGLRTLLFASGAALFFGGLLNVAELPFVTGDLGGSEAAYACVVALAGLGIAAGSLSGGAGGAPKQLRDRFLFGMMVMALGFLVSGLSGRWELLLITFVLAGFGNGVMLVNERLMLQELVPDHLAARVFGIRDALTAWAYAIAFTGAGVMASISGARSVMITSGAGVLLVWFITTARMRREVADPDPWRPMLRPLLPPQAAAEYAEREPELLTRG
jgi:MFS family permease